MIAEHLPALVEATSTSRACALLGASRATLYRRPRPPVMGPPPPRPKSVNKLSEAERQRILAGAPDHRRVRGRFQCFDGASSGNQCLRVAAGRHDDPAYELARSFGAAAAR